MLLLPAFGRPTTANEEYLLRLPPQDCPEVCPNHIKQITSTTTCSSTDTLRITQAQLVELSSLIILSTVINLVSNKDNRQFGTPQISATSSSQSVRPVLTSTRKRTRSASSVATSTCLRIASSKYHQILQPNHRYQQPKILYHSNCTYHTGGHE